MVNVPKFTEPKPDNEEDAAFMKNVELVLSKGKRDYPSIIGGLNVASGVSFDVFSPIDKSIIFGTCQEAEEGLTDRAVEVAKNAFNDWSEMSAEKRITIFKNALENIKSQRYRLAAMVSLSVGMTKGLSLNEVDRLIDVIEMACKDASTVKGKPIGVWAILTSFNSPLAAPIGYVSAAVLAGNTAVMMPSPHSILPIVTVIEMLFDSGLPVDVINIVLDRNKKTTNDLANNLDVLGVVASGSGERMEDLMFLQVDDELKFINEIKGMNPILVYKPSDIKAAAKTVINSAFKFDGQLIQSCSKVVVMENQQEAFINALIAEAISMKITDPLEPDAFTGPIISKKRAEKFKEILNDVSDCLIFGGNVVKGPMTENGYYITPAILTGLMDDDELNNIDIALPILSIQIVKNLDDAIDVINCTECGISAGIITKDEKAAERFMKEIIANEKFVNDPQKIIGAAGKAFISNFIQ